MATYWALVGPEGTNPSLWPDARQAKRAVREGLVTAAEVNPMYASDIEMVLVHLEVATEFFVDYFRIDDEPWTAQFRPVSTVETD